MDNKRIGLIIVALIFLGFIAYAATAKTTRTISEGGGSVTTPGLGGFIKNPFGWIKDLFGGGGGSNNSGSDCYNPTATHPGCLSSRPGYNCKGELDSYC